MTSSVPMPEFLYVVFLCYTMDDIPMAIFSGSSEAFDYAEQLSWDVPDAMQRRLELPESSTPCCVSLVTFRNGLPVSRVVVRQYDSEDE